MKKAVVILAGLGLIGYALYRLRQTSTEPPAGTEWGMTRGTLHPIVGAGSLDSKRVGIDPELKKPTLMQW